ncbi:hypothetical protein Q0S19_07690 [Stenotrophomonas indicatrix]|uniref:hypothetical protein n=1 Tax=Stenotrophomonas indicatrix TaxID=2045451 RepID=UPI0026552B05|nr:hypothetical protein [Stenotrophomonas indicatrix]MDN8644340.1 hypothetical protein [Stenotrophomonas indicatrix]MDN8654788.1 hypothetical protein [Stenotrophomonas indicatrix]
MKLSFTADCNWEAKVGRIKSHYAENSAEFARRTYGGEVVSVALLFVCRDPELNLSRRVQFRRKKAEFYTDVMLDLPTIIPLSMKEKMRYVSAELLEQLSEQLNKVKFKDFDHARFLQDLEKWLKEIESRYDGKTSGSWRYDSGEER